MEVYVHPTAVVDEGAEIGKGSKVWHFVHVSEGARIGSEVSLGQNVFVGDNAVIGDGCKIQNNVSIYDNVRLEENVFCGPSMVFTNVYNPRAFIDRRNDFLDTLVGRGATLGANCTIVCGVKVGEFAFVGAGAVVNRDVQPYALIVGVPGRQIGWVSRSGERMKIEALTHAGYYCDSTDELYRLVDGEIQVSLS